MSQEALARIITRLVPGLARAAVKVPIRKNGTVAANGSAAQFVDVDVDGDPDGHPATALLNGTGRVLGQGQRVACEWYGDSGGIVSGVLGTVLVPEQVFTTTLSVASSTSVSEDSSTWNETTTQGFGWAPSSGDLVCAVAGLWIVGVQGRWDSDGAGTQRLVEAGPAGSGHQFPTGGGGAPTSGYGLAGGGFGTGDYAVGDTIDARARQDSGSTLDVDLTVTLRLHTPA